MSLVAQPLNPTFHPLFQAGQSQDDDIVLCSSDATHYRLPSFILPQTFAVSSPSASIPIDFPAEVITPLLLILSGLPVPKFINFEKYSQTVLLGQTWRVPLCSLRSAVLCPSFMKDPLAVYALASRCGWDSEAALSAKKTLSVDLFNEGYSTVLASMPAGALVRLLKYHRARRDAFRASLGDTFGEKCSCGVKVEGGEWRALKARMVAEVENGNDDAVCSLEMEEWTETEACWAVTCKECNEPIYNRVDTFKFIRAAVKGLPLFQ